MLIKPVSVLAFVLALVAVVMVLTGFWLPRWFVLLRAQGTLQHWHGLWQQQRCSSTFCSQTSSFTRIEGGKEFFFISKIYNSLAATLAFIGFVLHLIYAFWRKPWLRQASIYFFCGSGLFGLLCCAVVGSKYERMAEYDGQLVKLGSGFHLSLAGAFMCLLASAITALASYKKATHNDEEYDDCKEITHEVEECKFE